MSIPGGSDAATIESITQALKSTAGAVNWVQSSAELCPPILPASATSGYSTVVYTSFGGTVQPSGNGSTYNSHSGTNFVLKITLGGAVATAKFKTSVDGGTTFGAEQTTAASMTDATSGITLAFAGTMTLNGLAQFQSAFTPTLVLTDTAGSARALNDFNGLRMGRTFEGYEGYLGQAFNSTITSNGTFLQGSTFRIGLNGTGTTATFISDHESSSGSHAWCGATCELDPGTTNANRISIECGGTFVGPWADNCMMQFETAVYLATVGASNQTCTVGYWLNTAAPRKSSSTGIWFQRASGGNWRAQVVSSSSAFVDVDTGITPVASHANILRIAVYGSGTALGTAYGGGGALVLFFIDGALVASGADPSFNATSTVLSLGAEIVNTSGLGGAQQAFVSPWRWVQVVNGNYRL